MVMIRIDARAHGSLLSGLARRILGRYKEDVVGKVADEGVNMIRLYLPEHYMYLGHEGGDPRHNPVPPNAGTLVESIHTDRASTDRALIIGDDVIYGAWIEGDAVGNSFIWPGRVKRGLSPRFPGYHAFRTVAQVLQDRAVEVAYRELPGYIEEINHAE